MNSVESKCGIYAIINVINQKRYVGYSQNIRNRQSQHLSKLRRNKHDNPHLQAAWNIFKEENFIIEILQECSKEELNFWEDYWVRILKLNDREFGYNIEITDPNKKGRHSDETKIRMHNKRTGSKHVLDEEQQKRKILRIKNSGRKVIDINTKIIYDTITEAADAINIEKWRLDEWLRGVMPNKSNYVFYDKYLENSEFNWSDIVNKQYTPMHCRKIINIKTGEIFDKIIDAANSIDIKVKVLYSWLQHPNRNKTDLQYYEQKLNKNE